MNKDNIKTEIVVKDRKIGVLRIGNREYISLTDLARYADNKSQDFLLEIGWEVKK